MAVTVYADDNLLVSQVFTGDKNQTVSFDLNGESQLKITCDISWQATIIGLIGATASLDIQSFRKDAVYREAHGPETYYLRARYYEPLTSRMLSPDQYWNTGNMIYGNGGGTTPSLYAIRQSSNLYVYCMNNPINLFDPSGLAAVVMRDYITQYGGTVTWNEKTGIATFTISGIKITTTSTGINSHGLDIWNTSGRMMADDADLNAYFGGALTWGKQDSKAGDFAMGGLALGGVFVFVDPPFEPLGDVAGLIVAGGALIIAGGMAIYGMANAQNGKYGDATVKDVLKHKKGSIKQAPLPSGGPNWNDLIRDGVTMETIRRLADKGEIGFKEIWKLLNEIRFNK